MAVTVTYAATVNTVETLSTNVPAISTANNTITHSGYSTTATLTASTTPPVTQCAYFLKALTVGAATIDLTALTGTNGATINGTGLKVQVAKFKNPATNANNITVKFGAANPYNLLGASWTLILAPGQEITVYGNDATPDIAAGAKDIDLSGTGSQELQCSIIMG